jgi:hypothetical protein
LLEVSLQLHALGTPLRTRPASHSAPWAWGIAVATAATSRHRPKGASENGVRQAPWGAQRLAGWGSARAFGTVMFGNAAPRASHFSHVLQLSHA